MKCSKCKKDFAEEELEKVGKKHYCMDCYNDYYLPEVLDWNNLFETIKAYNNLKTLPINVITLLKKYHSDDKLTYFGMNETYKYIKEYADIKDLKDKDNGNYMVGLIPYFYTKAGEFFSECCRLEELAENSEEDKEVVIKSKQYNELKIKKDIDFSSINFEEDEK